MSAQDDRPASGTSKIQFGIGDCPLGQVLVATRPPGICAIFLGDDQSRLRLELRRTFPGIRLIPAHERCAEHLQQTRALIERPGTRLEQPLDIQGTPFQRRVWAALQQIPPGETLSYAQVAERIGAPRSARAVAQACASNLLAIAVPCHRVVRADGRHSGYRWGVERKRALLARELGIATLSVSAS
ncbi:methylated-DNA--[protein]-cysteine S-methyltransferase [Thiorhodococcus minor]|uniref:methylated-DNA--[protein]-cysteine S-methyltransferase n=1 Tax=Thiorhodococcus minor TaxID=57489 RepID=A0A6M0K342_9GAMM|nr:methylated-DNA--[protein]-cysteine S-methyltransferase [Thiorhodococcus minor]NEV63789.1 methylated-DNA--[protein]-cysteine S-methyltransferase [Thiorhodococcus minor]